MTSWVRGLRHGMGGLAVAGCDLLFPPQCVSCEAELPDGGGEFPFCPECLKQFGPAVWHGCRRCGSEVREVVDADAAQNSADSARRAALRFDTVIPLGAYDAGLRDAVLRMKRPAHDRLSLAIGRVLAARRGEQLAGLGADLIVPVPMFWWRRLRRGKQC